MNTMPGTTTTVGHAGRLDPRPPAARLDQSAQQSRRGLQASPPWLLATRAGMVLAACGAVWLSVRGQHPYQGPTASDVPILVAFIVLNFGATVTVRRRAAAGARDRSGLRPAEIAIVTLAWVAAVAALLALAAAGVSFGRYPTTLLIAPGLAWAAVTAVRGGWRSCGTGLAVTAVGVAGAFAGPAGSWAVAAVGLCAVLLGTAAVIAWRRHG